MKVVRARVSGFCMGVRRAVDLACTQANACLEAAVCHADSCMQTGAYTLGPLIHNPKVLEELERRGVQVIDENRLPYNLNNVSVIIRAHGISPQTEAELRERGAKVIDATCPRVKASQLKAAAFAEAGFGLFLAGEEHHAEIAGIKGYAQAGFARSEMAPFCVTVGNTAEAGALARRLSAGRLFTENADTKTALIGQTTITAEEYKTIGEAVKKYFPNVEIAQTICPATEERQESLRELTDTVEAVIIAGGKESANTRRLLAVAQTAGIPCVLVETEAEIPPEFFCFKTVGLAAGASTPDSLVDAIEQMLENGVEY